MAFFNYLAYIRNRVPKRQSMCSTTKALSVTLLSRFRESISIAGKVEVRNRKQDVGCSGSKKWYWTNSPRRPDGTKVEIIDAVKRE